MWNKNKQTIERLKDTFYQNNAKGTKHFQKVTLYEEGIEDILSLLNMVEEKDKIINEQLEENVKLQSELNEENNRCMILANNDKFKEQVINLMAEWISERCFYIDEYSNSCEVIQDSCYKEKNCKECIKQYFERKVEDE